MKDEAETSLLKSRAGTRKRKTTGRAGGVVKLYTSKSEWICAEEQQWLCLSGTSVGGKWSGVVLEKRSSWGGLVRGEGVRKDSEVVLTW